MVRALTLMYHAVSDAWEDALAIRVSDLERQLADLAAAGFRGATARQILEQPGDRRLLHATFDDAYASVANALPALRRHGIPATVFVCTDLAGEGRPLAIPELERVSSRDELRTMTWDELCSLAADGLVEIGSHTKSHPHLTRLADVELLTELRDSKAAIEDRLGRRTEFLAYPFGEEDRRVRRAASLAGYAGAFAAPGTSLRFDPFRLPRTGLWRDEPAARQRFKTRFGVRVATQAARNAGALRARARLR